jgi:hypothetical protein
MCAWALTYISSYLIHQATLEVRPMTVLLILAQSIRSWDVCYLNDDIVHWLWEELISTYKL